MAKEVNLPPGFSLKEPDDHVVELWYEGECVDRFSSSGVTAESLLEAALQHLKAPQREK